MLKEFREFALKGNLVDLAVAFVMGAAFTKLSTSFIEDLFMPLLAGITGKGVDFSNKFLPLSGEISAANLGNLVEAKKQGAVFAYGNFITIGLNFLIVAFAMFLVVKMINKAKAASERPKEAAAPDAPSREETLLAEIRDLLKNKA
jgi:large conductance mechanosensitive channel